MDRTERVELTVMVAVTDGGKVLVQDKRGPNVWGLTFPGGHVEPEESFAQAAVREVREETGLTVTAPKLRGVMHWIEEGGRYLAAIFTAEEFSGTLRSSREGTVSWVAQEGFEELPLAENVADAFRLALGGETEEKFYPPQER